jgi:hypothetical protein
MKKISTILALLWITMSAMAQPNKEPQPAWLIQPSIAWHMPGGDMKEYFGNNFNVGIGAAYKTKSNWRFGFDGQYLFSDNIKNPEQILEPLLTDRGFILNGIGNYASISLLERGFFFTGEAGKSLNFWQANPNSGPDFQLGIGYLMHWIEIKNAGNDAPQVLGEYSKGYDRLSGGLMLRQSIGYTYLSRNRRVNFRFSFEIIEAFTQNYRGFDYSTGGTVDGRRTDLLYGFRFQWMLPIYTTAAGDTYYYD